VALSSLLLTEEEGKADEGCPASEEKLTAMQIQRPGDVPIIHTVLVQKSVCTLVPYPTNHLNTKKRVNLNTT
jgi:hypothetical protein